MKKLEILLTVSAVTLCSLTVWYVFFRSDNDYEALAAHPTAVRFEKENMQLGTIKYGTQHKLVFRFVNTGETPLLIHDIRPTCGCTSVKWIREPVKPGESGEIVTFFNPTSLGVFSKTITVDCNVPESIVQLKISGNVID